MNNLSRHHLFCHVFKNSILYFQDYKDRIGIGSVGKCTF